MAESPDSHDLDKLTRWHEGLTSQTGEGFPVCALFLVSLEDVRAHDIFRVYRTAVEELGAGFNDLVIFGQHGVSNTSAALVSGLGLSGLQIPSLALITTGAPPGCHSAALPAGALPKGESEQEEAGKEEQAPWKKALESIRDAVRAGTSLSLDGVTGLERRDFSSGTLAESVGRVKQQVERA